MGRRGMRGGLSVLVAAALAACFGAGGGNGWGDRDAAGRIMDADGAPVPGATVTYVHEASGRRFTVYADSEGRWRAPALPAGPLTLEVRGADPEDDPRAIVQGTAEDLTGIITLTSADPAGEPRASDFLSQLPDGPTKNRFIVDCGGCHTFASTHARLDGTLRTREEWSAPIQMMLSMAGPSTGFPIISSMADADADARWLVESLAGAGSPEPSRLPGTERRVGAALTEYDIPEPMDLPHDVVVMPDGRLLITGMMTHRLYILDPGSGSYEIEPLPVQYANPRAIDIDDGGRWVVALGAPRSVAVRDRETEEWTTHDVGLYPHSVALDGGGGVWVNGHFSARPEVIARLDLVDGSVQRFEVPHVPGDAESTIPYGLRVAHDGIVWGTQLRGNRLIRLDPASGGVRTWDMPVAHSGPRRPDVGPDGVVWIPEFGAGSVARFDPETETFTRIPLPLPDTGPYVVRVDQTRGTVWLGTGHGDVVFSIDPDSHQVTSWPLPTRGALIRHIDVDESTGEVWVAYGASPGIPAKVLRIQPAPFPTPP